MNIYSLSSLCTFHWQLNVTSLVLISVKIIYVFWISKIYLKLILLLGANEIKWDCNLFTFYLLISTYIYCVSDFSSDNRAQNSTFFGPNGISRFTEAAVFILPENSLFVFLANKI